MKVDALVFDFGGVLVEIDFGRAFAAWAVAAGASAPEIAARFAVDDAYCAYERGEIGEREYFAGLRRSLDLRLSDAQFIEGWNAIFGEPLAGIEPLVERLAGRFPLYVFSNTNPAHVAHFAPRYRTLLAHFRRTITSCDIGRRKPEPEAFARVAELVGAPPGRLAFFDDLEENIAGARRAGLLAFRVSRPAEIGAIAEQL